MDSNRDITSSANDRRARRGGMWAAWFCVAVGVLLLLSFFF